MKTSLYQIIATNKQTGLRAIASNPMDHHSAQVMMSKMTDYPWRILTVESYHLPLGWDFVEKHYPDYSHSGTICLSSDMDACLEFAELDAKELITDESVGRLKAQAPDKDRSTEPSWHQVRAFDDFIDTGMTFQQAADEVNDYCLARAIRHYPADADKLPDWYDRWADEVLAN